MKSIFSIAIFTISLWPSIAFSELCQKLEFDELTSLSNKEILAIRCKYMDSMIKSINSDYNLMMAGKIDPSYVGVNNCSSEITRIDRIIIKKFNLKPRKDGAYNISTDEGAQYELESQIVEMCSANKK